MDFLTFKSFISIEALIIFYYVGAIILPIGIWLFVTWLIKKYDIVNLTYEKGKEAIWKALNAKQKIKLITFLIFCFFFMELFWRMLFEFLIAYMQIRDAVLQAPL